MFRPIPAIIRFSSDRVLVFISIMWLCNDVQISSSVVLVITTTKRRGCGGFCYVFIGVHCLRRCLLSLQLSYARFQLFVFYHISELLERTSASLPELWQSSRLSISKRRLRDLETARHCCYC